MDLSQTRGQLILETLLAPRRTTQGAWLSLQTSLPIELRAARTREPEEPQIQMGSEEILFRGVDVHLGLPRKVSRRFRPAQHTGLTAHRQLPGIEARAPASVPLAEPPARKGSKDLALASRWTKQGQSQGVSVSEDHPTSQAASVACGADCVSKSARACTTKLLANALA